MNRGKSRDREIRVPFAAACIAGEEVKAALLASGARKVPSAIICCTETISCVWQTHSQLGLIESNAENDDNIWQ